MKISSASSHILGQLGASPTTTGPEHRDHGRPGQRKNARIAVTMNIYSEATSKATPSRPEGLVDDSIPVR
ncbi:hypothetical protein [Rhizomonospora bruguierae]|uniref:hypothetical protein n=1 Tax=Rhizomonospora bruguierae TaxID=1581705 RepID=UPI001BCE94B7|nr:hypothetical protein [Micromonospora sp. NBRC 107566]